MDVDLDKAWIASLPPPAAIVRKADPLDDAWKKSLPPPSTTKPSIGTAVTVTKVLAPGWHLHRCINGHEWSHTDAQRGDIKAHTCPICGKQDWNPKERGVRLITKETPAQPKPLVPATQPLPKTFNPGTCPGGVCPTCPNGRCPTVPEVVYPPGQSRH